MSTHTLTPPPPTLGTWNDGPETSARPDGRHRIPIKHPGGYRTRNKQTDHIIPTLNETHQSSTHTHDKPHNEHTPPTPEHTAKGPPPNNPETIGTRPQPINDGTTSHINTSHTTRGNQSHTDNTTPTPDDRPDNVHTYHLEGGFNAPDDQAYEQGPGARVAHGDVDWSPPSKREWVEAVRKQKNRKAPDGLTRSIEGSASHASCQRQAV